MKNHFAAWNHEKCDYDWRKVLPENRQTSKNNFKAIPWLRNTFPHRRKGENAIAWEREIHTHTTVSQNGFDVWTIPHLLRIILSTQQIAVEYLCRLISSHSIAISVAPDSLCIFFNVWFSVHFSHSLDSHFFFFLLHFLISNDGFHIYFYSQ